MAETPSYAIISSGFENGVGEVRLSKWWDFVAYIHESIVDDPGFVWRGQKSEAWPLQPSLERLFEPLKIDPASDDGDTHRFEHMSRFKLAVRGHVDPHDLEERLLDPLSSAKANIEVGENTPLGPSLAEREENNWWALGQHYGLSTPLLDWSTSPFVAAFFAFMEPSPICEQSEDRAIYGLHRPLVSLKSDEIRELDSELGRSKTVSFIEPLYKGNPRIVNQGGLFTRTPDGVDVKKWIQDNFTEGDDEVYLLKLTLPDEDREHILRFLNRMNINHRSLFPDLYGATGFVNMRLKIQNY